MAQPQTQAKPATSLEAKGMKHAPATTYRGRPPAAWDLMRWAGSPFGLMRRLSEDVDQLFNQLSGGSVVDRAQLMGLPAAALATAIDWIPAVETFERAVKLVIQTDLPGLAADDVAVEVVDGILTISGERRDEQDIDDRGLRRTERRYGRFTRSLALPEGAQVEQIEASFRDGVLEITVPLAQSAAQQRRTIDVKRSAESGQNGPQRATSPGESTSSSTARPDAGTARSTATT
jgi:HSP20 family protein